MRNPLFLVVVLLLSFTACTAQQKAPGHTVEDLVSAMRLRDVHRIRIEPNPKQTKLLKTRVVDMYVGGQQMIVLQAASDVPATNFVDYFGTYRKLGRRILTNQNLLLIVDPNAQKEIQEAFETL